MLGGIGRFVEESFRGEPQTLKYAGLPVYQWLALIGVFAGAIIMTFQGKPCTLETTIMPWAFLYAAVFGIIVAIAMGVDFPESERRFSRLT